MLENQEKCKTCGSKLIQKATRRSASQLKKQYYYTAYYFCTKCRKIYHNDKFKVINDNQASFLGELSSSRQARTIIDYDVEIWTDGACVSNGRKHAKSAWSFVSSETEKAGLVPGAKQTNNVAEGLAIFHALEWATKNNFKKIKIYTDSQITIYNLKKTANKVKINQEIFQKIENIIHRNKLEVSYEKVLGHSGDVNNERADKLANDLAGKE